MKIIFVILLMQFVSCVFGKGSALPEQKGRLSSNFSQEK